MQQRLCHAEVAVSVFDLDRGVVHQDSDRQRQASQGHHVDGLSQQARMLMEARMDSGIEMHTISVLRQLPRKSRIISAGEGRGDQSLA